MEWITDSELRTLLASARPPIANVGPDRDLESITSQIQPCSVDLRIEEIFLPVAKDSAVDSVLRTFRHDLKVGESVRVSTTESFELGDEFAGIVFAPVRLSRRGVVVPDIGHIDPGFRGELRMTLINMGRDTYELQKGQIVATVLLFRLNKRCAYGLGQRKGAQPYDAGLEDIRHLAPDFLNITKTARRLARGEAERLLGASGWRYAFYSVFLPIIVGIVGGFATYYFQVQRELDTFRIGMEAKVDSLVKASDVEKQALQLKTDLAQSKADVDTRLADMQRQIDELSTASLHPNRSKHP